VTKSTTRIAGVTRRIGLLVMAAIVWNPTARAQAPAFVSPLPPEIMRTLSEHFRGGRVTGFSRERERGLWVFEVRIRKGRERWEATLTRDGGLLEAARAIRPRDLPPMIALTARTKLRFTRLLRVERHERYGVLRAGKYRPLDKPRISYEVSYIGPDGRRHERRIRSSGVMELPASVLTALQSRFKGWNIHEAEMDSDGDVDLYTVELQGPQKQTTEVVLDEKGTVWETETRIPAAALPHVVVATVRKDPVFRRKQKPDVDIRRRDVYARIENGKVVPSHEVSYSVTLLANGKMRQYQFDARGRLLSRSKWESAPAIEDEDDEND